MSDVADAEAIAAQLRVNASSLTEMEFGDQVVVTHEPPKDTDGPVDGERLRAVSRAEVDAMARAFVEPPERELIGVSVAGSRVTTSSSVRGVLVDGTKVDYRTEVVLEVQEGKIVGLHARLDDANAEQHRAALAAGAFVRPGDDDAVP